MSSDSIRKRFSVGDKVLKNYDTWIPNDFDSWGRGEGIGVVVEPPFPLPDSEVDVRWPSGRCFEYTDQLLSYVEENQAQKISSQEI